jgi:molybdopterin converting factor small subunit
MDAARTDKAAKTSVAITVELFGTARITCGQHEVALELPASTSLSALASSLANACPALIGNAIVNDMSGLMKSYTLNLNGTAFVSDAPGQHIELQDGDRLLLFSSQAGG